MIQSKLKQLNKQVDNLKFTNYVAGVSVAVFNKSNDEFIGVLNTQSLEFIPGERGTEKIFFDEVTAIGTAAKWLFNNN